ADGGNERTLARDAAWPEWSPDGDKILFEQLTDEDTGHLPVMRDDGSEAKALTSTLGDSCAEWSPDGQQIAFCRGPNGGEVYVMNPTEATLGASATQATRRATSSSPSPS